MYDGECYILYDPNRPSYWLPVTVKEVFDGMIAADKFSPIVRVNPGYWDKGLPKSAIQFI